MAAVGATTSSASAANAPAKHDARLWERVYELLEHAPTIDALQAHGLLHLGVRRWRAIGRPVPRQLEAIDRGPAIAMLTAPVLLRRVRDAYDGRIMVLKGPLVAERYPDWMRSFTDVDLLVDDAGEAQRALLASGFVEVDEPELFVDIHHLRPLALPGFPLKVELHTRPKCPARIPGTTAGALFESARGGALGHDDLLEPSTPHHAMLLAAHGWGHGPLRSLRDLLDVAVMAQDVEEAELASTARAWGMTRVWATTAGAIDCVLYERARPTLALRSWARHLAEARERTVLESHLEHWVSAFWGLPIRSAFAEALGAFTWELKPAEGESWGDKLRRSAHAIRRASSSRSEHERQLGDLARHGDLRRIVRQRRADERASADRS